MVRTKYLVVYFSLMVSLLIFVGAMSDGSVSNFVSGNVPVNVPIESVPIVVPHCDVPVLLVKDIAYGLDMEGRHVFYVKVNSIVNTEEIWYKNSGLDGIWGTSDDGRESLIVSGIPIKDNINLEVSKDYNKSTYTLAYADRDLVLSGQTKVYVISSGKDNLFGTSDDIISSIFVTGTNTPGYYDIVGGPNVQDGIVSFSVSKTDLSGRSTVNHYWCDNNVQSGNGSCSTGNLNYLNNLNFSFDQAQIPRNPPRNGFTIIAKTGSRATPYFTYEFVDDTTINKNFELFQYSTIISKVFGSQYHDFQISDNIFSSFYLYTQESYPNNNLVDLGIGFGQQSISVVAKGVTISVDYVNFPVGSIFFKGSMTIGSNNQYLLAWNELVNNKKQITVKPFQRSWEEAIKGTTEPYIVGVDGNSVVFYDKTKSGVGLY